MPVRVALFGSFYGGRTVLSELLKLEGVEIVGIATDDPKLGVCNAKKRLWRLPHTAAEERMVRLLAAENGIPAFTSRINSGFFYYKFEQIWKPDLCLMATFGQRIPKRLIRQPVLGFYNFHHSQRGIWPSYPGPTPIEHMLRDGRTKACISVHQINEELDDGPLFDQSNEIDISNLDTAVMTHRRSWCEVSGFIRRTLIRLLSGERTLGLPSLSEQRAEVSNDPIV